jgi:hypothetical protein
MKFIVSVLVLVSLAALGGCNQTTGYGQSYGYANGPMPNPVRDRCLTSAPPSAGCLGE